jgi:hypothetical protein
VSFLRNVLKNLVNFHETRYGCHAPKGNLIFESLNLVPLIRPT